MGRAWFGSGWTALHWMYWSFPNLMSTGGSPNVLSRWAPGCLLSMRSQNAPNFSHSKPRYCRARREPPQSAQKGIRDTHDELFVANGDREVSIERHTEVVRVVSRVLDDVLQQDALVSEDLR